MTVVRVPVEPHANSIHRQEVSKKMKMFKAAVAALSAFAVIGAASAQTATTIRITGSTAFRAATATAIGNILNPGYTYGYIGSSLNGANQSTFVGTTKIGNISVIIKCSFAGSVGGVQTIAQQSPVVTTASPYISESNALTTSGLVLTAASAAFDSPANADIAMSDTFQSSTAFNGTGYNTLTDTVVGVVPFVWTKGVHGDSAVSASLANVTNMTPLLARAVLNGGAPLSMFTGTVADSTVYVYGMGRDEDSGTRLTTFAESGFGVFGSPIQFEATITSGAIASIAAYRAQTILGISYPAGHSGYSSGGTLATTLNTPVAATARDTLGAKFALIAYFGVNDANGVNGGNNNLTYNGVPYSVANVQEGKYTFWGYEHLMYRSTLTGNQKTVADQIANQIKTQDATVSGVLLSSMHVSRTTEGAVVTHN
jgi:hypothetical protein